ncbi:MAG: GatB/YqeY domain-containing protein [Chloroflexota bacterium]|nr:MAG: aspartyl-tRNA amidotransferase [Chloroflexota bacterium]
MQDPREQISAALKQAMREQDTVTRDVLRMALNAIGQVEVDQRKTLSAEEVLAVLQREAKTRREAIAEAENAGRDDLAKIERERLAILERFLPQQLSRQEVENLAREAIAQSGATSVKEMGKVMAILMPKVKGIADGRLVNEVVRELLSS